MPDPNQSRPVRKQHSFGRDTLQTNWRDDDRELETTIVDRVCGRAEPRGDLEMRGEAAKRVKLDHNKSAARQTSSGAAPGISERALTRTSAVAKSTRVSSAMGSLPVRCAYGVDRQTQRRLQRGRAHQHHPHRWKARLERADRPLDTGAQQVALLGLIERTRRKIHNAVSEQRFPELAEALRARSFSAAAH